MMPTGQTDECLFLLLRMHLLVFVFFKNGALGINTRLCAALYVADAVFYVHPPLVRRTQIKTDSIPRKGIYREEEVEDRQEMGRRGTCSGSPILCYVQSFSRGTSS